MERMTARPRRRLGLPLALLLLLWGQWAAAETLLFYEALPAAQVALPKARTAPYAEKQRLAEAVALELVPGIVDALAFDPMRAKTAIAPGGYGGRTNPSLQTALPATAAEARTLAAALGYVLRQESVLVADLADASGDSFQVAVGFGRAPDADLAQRFFAHAIQIDKGLAGGYSVVDAGMVFVNLRGADGRPLGGLDDAAFLSALRRAAEGFPGARIAASGKCRAYLLENDWARAGNGEEFAAALGEKAGALMLLRLKHTVIVETLAARYGWR
jgi:hypothetical protein